MKNQKKENKVFAQGFCFIKIFVMFLLGCLIGTYYEEILWYIRYGEIVDRQGLIYGPFSPIYGIGVAIFVIFLGKNNDKRNLLKTFLFASLIGGITEFMTSLIADKIFNVQFWDYTGYFLNICGRTTIPFMLIWGLGGTILMKVVYPFISKLIEKIPYKIGKIIYIVVLIFIILDLIITYGALGRMVLRDHDVKPYTIVGKFFDNHYSDEYLYNKFPIMKPEEK